MIKNTSIFKENGGVSLVELLVSLTLLVLATMTALGFFGYALGGIDREGNRRAAYEQARARLEVLTQTSASAVNPPSNGSVRWLTCTGSPCTWTLFSTRTTETAAVNDLSRTMETTVQWANDPTNDPPTGTPPPDTLEFIVRVWYTTRATDDDFNRVHVRMLRTP